MMRFTIFGTPYWVPKFRKISVKFWHGEITSKPDNPVFVPGYLVILPFREKLWPITKHVDW